MVGLVVWSIIFVAGMFGLAAYGLSDTVSQFVTAISIFAGALVLNQLVSILIWKDLVPRWTGYPVPRLLGQVTLVVFAATAIGIIMVQVYQVPVTGVLTTSGVFIAIIGFALRNMISDVFTGIALGVERPFTVGDWIQIVDGTIGRVVEMNWRSTRLITREEISIVIPNSELAISTFKNFSKPERAWRDEFDILLHQSVTTHQAERILLSAINQVPEIVAVGKPPEVRISRFTENGIVWQLRYWVPDYQDMSRLRYAVQRAVSRNMHYAGLTIPAEQVQVNAPVAVEYVTFDLLRRVDLFDPLTDSELASLRHSAEEVLTLARTVVVREGEQGESLFVVREGLLEVSIPSDDGEFAVATLLPGSFFGEMSLLTGDPRHATVTAMVDSVVLEINKNSFEPIIRARPEIARMLSATIENRHQHNQQETARRTVKQEVAQTPLLERILAFFSISVDESTQISR